MSFTLGMAGNISRWLILLFLLFLPPYFSAQAEDHSPRKPQLQKSLDPMNRPMDELGVTGNDDTLCSDRRYSCTSYDRQQFDQKSPGQLLKDLLRYGKPDWPDKLRERQDRNDSLDSHDRLDKD